MDATERHQLLLNLDERQLRALDVLCAGGTHQEAADAADVDRVTVSRWNAHHPAFIAERNRRKYELAAAAEARMRTLKLRAFDVIEQRLVEGDLSAALGLLKWLG